MEAEMLHALSAASTSLKLAAWLAANSSFAMSSLVSSAISLASCGTLVLGGPSEALGGLVSAATPGWLLLEVFEADLMKILLIGAPLLVLTWGQGSPCAESTHEYNNI